MVFLSLASLIRSRGPDEIWRKGRIFRLTAHYRNRNRNCYGIAIRAVHRALVYATKGRKLKKLDRKDMWEQRIAAGSREYGTMNWPLAEGLDRTGVQLDRMSLSDLAAWETRSFGALAALAQHRLAEDQIELKSPDSPVDYVQWKLFTRNKIR